MGTAVGAPLELPLALDEASQFGTVQQLTQRVRRRSREAAPRTAASVCFQGQAGRRQQSGTPMENTRWLSESLRQRAEIDALNTGSGQREGCALRGSGWNIHRGIHAALVPRSCRAQTENTQEHRHHDSISEMAILSREPRASEITEIRGCGPGARAIAGDGEHFCWIGRRIQRHAGSRCISDKVFGEVQHARPASLTGTSRRSATLRCPQALDEFKEQCRRSRADALSKATLRPELGGRRLNVSLDFNQIVQFGKRAPLGCGSRAGNDAMLARLDEQFDTG